MAGGQSHEMVCSFRPVNIRVFFPRKIRSTQNGPIFSLASEFCSNFSDAKESFFGRCFYLIDVLLLNELLNGKWPYHPPVRDFTNIYIYIMDTVELPRKSLTLPNERETRCKRSYMVHKSSVNSCGRVKSAR